ncbi:CDP-glucose 4,6-dehydratase [uncultured Erythrobacter sp.]|uniref:CDP-glucose 4,6-dehydratase n=1 Tax=uncultured Erythrobacter sp. TaxID=263913 RepID=UPI00265AF434|nr:CDP-glucose 4,6-dehydratase [uncultured Erythrobacter sp.]
MTLAEYFCGRRVLVTGHTGFKGSWLTRWLVDLGAEVTGFSNEIPTQPSLFELLGCENICDHRIGDICNQDEIEMVVREGAFDVVFHLAAQSLVRKSYADPIATIATNILGTGHVLEAVRHAGHPCNIVAITSDKCYANEGSLWGFRETDPMGGHDPYSMSKGAAELVIDSWRRSYFSDPDSPIRLASARAGNVIGGGDWAQDRIVPDCVSSLIAGKPIKVRNPVATRPWQHVVEPLGGYLLLAARMADTSAAPVDQGWNFGPRAADTRSVRELVECLLDNWGAGSWIDASSRGALDEAKTLSLNCEKAALQLQWHPVWDFKRAVEETVRWYKVFARQDTQALQAITLEQVRAYQSEATIFDLPVRPSSNQIV